MLYRLVRPVKRKGSSKHHFAQRIPADMKTRAVGLTLETPVGDETASVTVTPGAQAVRLSLRASEASEVKKRHAQVAAYLETVWQGLRKDEPEVLPHAVIVALSKEAYGWGSLAEMDPEFSDAESAYSGEVGSGIYATALARMEAGTDPRGQTAEQLAARIAETILARHGKFNVAAASKHLLAHEVLRAYRDGFAQGDRETAGDFSPDPKAARFPKLDLSAALSGPTRAAGHVSLTGLVADWWVEAKAGGRSQSTYESYRGAVHRLADFLKHDNAAAVTPQDVVNFKDHRLKHGTSPKTVGGIDIAGLRSVFAWGVANLKLTDNPAEKVKVAKTKIVRLREKSFTPAEAKALLSQSSSHQRGREAPKLAAAKRWVPWLCAYTGARLGEIVQLRKQDLRKDGGSWVITITPEANTVKDKEVRQVVLHTDLVEQGFPAFVEAAAPGYLFLTPKKDGTVRGPWRTTKNRLTDFAREVVKDKDVAPNHGWRHLFKTIGREAGIADSVLDAICGHAAKTVGGTYGGVTLRAQVDAMAKFPRFDLADSKAADGGRP